MRYLLQLLELREDHHVSFRHAQSVQIWKCMHQLKYLNLFTELLKIYLNSYNTI